VSPGDVFVQLNSHNSLSRPGRSIIKGATSTVGPSLKTLTLKEDVSIFFQPQSARKLITDTACVYGSYSAALRTRIRNNLPYTDMHLTLVAPDPIFKAYYLQYILKLSFVTRHRKIKYKETKCLQIKENLSCHHERHDPEQHERDADPQHYLLLWTNGSVPFWRNLAT
jgi:hypothetical protein